MATYVGTTGVETLTGTSANDTFRLEGGTDTVIGGGGIDTVDLEDDYTNAVTVDLTQGTMTGWGTATLNGISQIYGGQAGGTLIGGATTTYIAAPGGNTNIVTGPQSTTVVLGWGSDTVTGGAGNDEIYVGGTPTSNNSNVIDGGGGYNGVSYVNAPGSLIVDLYAGVNGVGGGAWHNGVYDHLINIVNIQGNDNGDVLRGDYQNNIIIGGAGNDYIDGRGGNDTLTGGGGHDTFVMDGPGNSVITDFSTANDIIDLSSYGTFHSLGDVLAASSQQGANAVITLPAGSLTLDNVSTSSLQASDFSFTATSPQTTVVGTAGNNFTAAFQGGVRQYTVGSGGTTVSGGPENANDTLVDIHRIQFVDGYLTTSLTDTAAEVYRLYEVTLNRAPDQEGLTNWTYGLNTGTSLQADASGFVGSAEFQARYGALDNTAFVTLLYENALHRAPDPGGLNGWVNALNSGVTRAQVVLGFSESQENINNLAAPVEQGLWVGDLAAAEVARLYDTALGRLPDIGGLAGWTHALESGAASLQAMANGFVGSAEFQARYGALDNTGFVTLLYENSLHRAPDPGGLNSWVNALSGGETRAQVVLGFSDSPEHIADTAAHIDYGIWLA
jgi:hypothetical protein